MIIILALHAALLLCRQPHLNRAMTMQSDLEVRLHTWTWEVCMEALATLQASGGHIGVRLNVAYVLKWDSE